MTMFRIEALELDLASGRNVCRGGMTAIGRFAAVLALVLAMAVGAAGQGLKPSVVAAENFYGDIARQIGGDGVEVASILSNPDQDPHLFETTPTIVRQIAAARIVIFNGADYDAWMDKLLTVAPRVERTVLTVAELVDKQAGTKLTQRMLDIARRARIPVVGVTETQPMGMSCQDWMLMQLADLHKALAQPST